MQLQPTPDPKVTRLNFQYTDEHHPNAFIDFPPVQPPPPGRTPCPRCHGHGGWNIRMHAHQVPPKYPDTPENRHRFAHFQAACTNCNGWGHVPEAQGDHAHRWVTLRWTSSVHTQQCEDCGTLWEVDTSG